MNLGIHIEMIFVGGCKILDRISASGVHAIYTCSINNNNYYYYYKVCVCKQEVKPEQIAPLV